MKKISVNKSDEVAIIVEKIIESEEAEITLNIPRFSHFGESLSNFHLLKREADALGKRIFVESVDDQVIELAEMSGLNGVNPFLAKNKRQFSDIVAPKLKEVGKRRVVLKKEEEQSVEERPAEEYFSDLERNSSGLRKEEKKKFNWPSFSLPDREAYRKIFIAVVVLAVLGVSWYAAANVLPRAEVKIVAKKQNWIYNDSVAAEKSAALDPAKMTVPSQVFSQKKNVQLKFPATGKRKVEKSAGGEINVYNSYSSDPQTLVEKTRFVTPDGKLFRLPKTIVVPGAKIVDGKIAPSSIVTAVIADSAGPDYNIGPVKLFTIPGFKGTPKYQSFYGESVKNMSGGFIGEVAYPTDEDIKKAKTSAAATLEAGLKTALLSQVPKEFKMLDGAISYRTTAQKIDEEADKDGEFGIFSEAQMSVISFKENDVKELLARRASRDNGEDFETRSFTLDYGLARVDFDKGRISFPAAYNAILAKKINPEEIKARILGKSEVELKSMIFGLSGLESATISLWPFYVRTVPDSLNKIKVSVE